MHSNLIEGCQYLKTGVHDLKRDYFQKSVYMCGVQRYNLKQTLIGCPCWPYCKTSVHDSKRDYFQKRDISGGVNPHTLHTKKFIKEIRSKIPKKHKLSCHTRLVLLTPGLCVGVNPHTLHTKKCI